MTRWVVQSLLSALCCPLFVAPLLVAPHVASIHHALTMPQTNHQQTQDELDGRRIRLGARGRGADSDDSDDDEDEDEFDDDQAGDAGQADEDEDDGLQTNISGRDTFTLPSGQEIEKESLLPPDRVLLQQRIKDNIMVLAEFSKLRDPQRYGVIVDCWCVWLWWHEFEC